ncbi:hypothetical protein, partial [Bradyrhizobium sp. CCBAU 11386]|uniref:hypothetical protein n=1 Tax=Bradyrhizobium sp. CCBAU 11386 TaxID=1630837 RepID=UPI002303538C
WFDSTSPVWHTDAVRGPSTPSLRAQRSEAIQTISAETVWIASSHQRKIASQFCRGLLAMTELETVPWEARRSRQSRRKTWIALTFRSSIESNPT